jgi:hypothetical protein
MLTPLCKQHGGDGTKVADHVEDHKGDVNKFFDMANLQGACVPCHNAKPKTRGTESQAPLDIVPIGSETPGPIFKSVANARAVDAALLETEDFDDVKIP